MAVADWGWFFATKEVKNRRESGRWKFSGLCQAGDQEGILAPFPASWTDYTALQVCGFLLLLHGNT